MADGSVRTETSSAARVSCRLLRCRIPHKLRPGSGRARGGLPWARCRKHAAGASFTPTGMEDAMAREWPNGGSARVPNWVYTDPQIFARELERIFGASDWLYVCLEAELPNP